MNDLEHSMPYQYADFLVELMLVNTDFTIEEIKEMTREEINMHLGYD